MGGLGNNPRIHTSGAGARDQGNEYGIIHFTLSRLIEAGVWRSIASSVGAMKGGPGHACQKPAPHGRVRNIADDHHTPTGP